MSGQDYIGSKISLISLSDIRYVGILHSINTNDSTVSLENVRSFGTEGRRGNPEDEVKASDTVFDFVVFRGSDIKDLQVFEAPAKPTAPPPPSSRPQGMIDPSHRPTMEGYPPPPPPPMNPYMMPPYPPPQAMYWQSPMYPGQPPMPPSVTPPPQQQQQQSPPATSLRTTPPEEQPLVSPPEQLDQQEINSDAVENLAKQVSELDVDTEESLQSTTTSSQRQHNNNRNGRNPQYRQNNGSRNQNSKQRIDVPPTDFDFESSNAKFQKNDLLKGLVNDEQPDLQPEVIIPPPNDEDFYDKSKSFFDNISCESKERQDQDGNINRRGKFHEERKLNVETFGQASIDYSRSRNFRGRGGYRGGYRGNRGGYYHGGNRYNNNNNSNNSYGNYRSQQQQVEPQQ
ncbi:Scd6-like Sm domain-containing protein [Chlamydoabsidia padenii]|nr:Scd6-like Sm domain-containing protein [Chlamydoabsidia padenii]